jgi:hypothetical protein
MTPAPTPIGERNPAKGYQVRWTVISLAEPGNGCSIAFHFQPMTPPPTTTTLAPAAMAASVREVRR